MLPKVSPALACALMVGAAICAPPAAAADARATKEARVHFKKGEDFFKAGQYADAYREFEAGYGLSNRPLFLLNMAHAERRQSHLRSAQALYNSYLLLEPSSRYAPEVRGFLREIEGAIVLEAASARSPAVPPPVEAPPIGAEPARPVDPPAAVALAPPPPAPEAPPPPRTFARREPPVIARRQIEDDELPPRLRTEGPFYTRWWFWTGAAALVAGAAITGLALRRDSYVENGSLGTLRSRP